MNLTGPLTENLAIVKFCLVMHWNEKYLNLQFSHKNKNFFWLIGSNFSNCFKYTVISCHLRSAIFDRAVSVFQPSKNIFCARPKHFFGQNNFLFPIFGCIISIVCTSKCTMYWLVTKHVRINNICFGQIFPVSKTSVNDLFFCTSKFSIK